MAMETSKTQDTVFKDHQDSFLCFVYGSLLPGLHNDHLMQRATVLQRCCTLPEYTMYSLGHFPGVCERGSTAIQGMLYRIDAKTLLQLDMLEGHPNWYKRKLIFLPDAEAHAWMYILPSSETDHYTTIVVPNGDWRTYHEAILTRRQQTAPQP